MTLAANPHPPTGLSYFHSAHEQTEFFPLGRIALQGKASFDYAAGADREEVQAPQQFPVVRQWSDITRAAYLWTESLDVVGRHAFPSVQVTHALNTLALHTVDRFWTCIAAGLAELFRATPFETFTDLPERVEHPAARAFDQLAEWLEADNAAVAAAVGVGRTTRYSWSREEHDPRPSTVRKLYQTHATVDSLRRALGRNEFARWLYLGDPSHRELLLQGRLDAVQPSIREYVFQPSARNLPDLAAGPEDTDPIETMEVTETEAPRPSGRRRRTARI